MNMTIYFSERNVESNVYFKQDLLWVIRADVLDTTTIDEEIYYFRPISKEIIDSIKKLKLLTYAYEDCEVSIFIKSNVFFKDSVLFFKEFLFEEMIFTKIRYQIDEKLCKKIKKRIDPLFLSLRPKYKKIFTMSDKVENIQIYIWKDEKSGKGLMGSIREEFEDVFNLFF